MALIVKIHNNFVCYTQPMDKTATQNTHSVRDYIDSIGDEQIMKDSHALLEIMHRISDHIPKLWNERTIGFDTYHYKYVSDREGDGHIIGFYPRKGKITIYLIDGTARYAELLTKLGKHTVSGYCIYINQLSDIDLLLLEKILDASYTYIKSMSQDGPIDRILWQTEK
jgi:uncharacterized protein DUF1801